MSLAHRKEPEQLRSKDRVERILDATKVLLDRMGYEAMTMRAIAKQAEITQPSLYRYFENKQAIIRAIADGFVAQQEASVREAFAQADKDMPWIDVFRTFAKSLRSTCEKDRWMPTCLAAMKSDPELQPKDDQINARYADEFAKLLAHLGFTGSRAERGQVSEYLVSLFDMLLMEMPRRSRAKRNELEKQFLLSVERYLAPFFEN